MPQDKYHSRRPRDPSRKEEDGHTPKRSDRSRSPRKSHSGAYRDRGSNSERSKPAEDREVSDLEKSPVAIEKANFKPSGLLTKSAQTTSGKTTQKYFEPAEGCRPDKALQYRLYIFDDPNKNTDVIKLDQRSYYLIGRDRDLAHIPLENATKASGQHAVVQFRRIVRKNKYGETTEKVKPYLIDLESTNGTKLNGKLIETSRYIELISGDVIQFAASPEYVFLIDS